MPKIINKRLNDSGGRILWAEVNAVVRIYKTRGKAMWSYEPWVVMIVLAFAVLGLCYLINIISRQVIRLARSFGSRIFCFMPGVQFIERG